MYDATVGPKRASYESDAKPGTYSDTFFRVPPAVEMFAQRIGGLAGKRVLDFGCGEAPASIGLALENPGAEFFGVDILPQLNTAGDIARYYIGLDDLPANLSLKQISPGEDIEGKYDLIFSWSVFEHIDQRILGKVVRQIRNALTPSGRALIQIAPLYYSAFGSHLAQWIPQPWGHLSIQDDIYIDMLKEKSGVNFEILRYVYTSLNRITSEGLREALEDGGLTIEAEHESFVDLSPPKQLLWAYDEKALTREQIVYFCRVDAASDE